MRTVSPVVEGGGTFSNRTLNASAPGPIDVTESPPVDAFVPGPIDVSDSPPVEIYSPPPPPATGGIIAGGIIVTIVVLIIICAISCTCARKLRRALVSELQHAVATIPPISYAVQLWEIDAPTMERFLQDLAKEKPVRFTAQQLCNFTTNYATVLGSGGFGIVYKGQFPNGVKIAVKVLKRSLHDKRADEQFMAEALESFA